MSTGTFSDYFLEFRNVPQEWEEANNFLNWYLEDIVNQLNAKDGGIHAVQIIPSGKTLAIGATNFAVLRKTLNFGPLPNATTKSVAHGIPVNSDFRIFNLQLAASDPSDMNYFCTQNYSLSANGMVRLEMDATNVNVTTNADYTAYTDCFVIIEYYQ